MLGNRLAALVAAFALVLPAAPAVPDPQPHIEENDRERRTDVVDPPPPPNPDVPPDLAPPPQ
ncbi:MULTISPECIES: hypothetical protein [Mycobacterium simiae complex]|uniref:hypothetical protein n=1 Tax=Mycobacterium simiae complex TaxID=2249310 RepID=UPI00111C45E4|nr:MULTISPECIES: hypothetical protein [Mycobacterium simiae complex]